MPKLTFTALGEEFEVLSLVKQQRLVYGLLKDLMPQPIHALSLKINRILILTDSHLCMLR